MTRTALAAVAALVLASGVASAATADHANRPAAASQNTVVASSSVKAFVPAQDAAPEVAPQDRTW